MVVLVVGRWWKVIGDDVGVVLVEVVVTGFLWVAVVIFVRILKSGVYCVVVVGVVVLVVVVMDKPSATTATIDTTTNINATNKAMKHINK